MGFLLKRTIVFEEDLEETIAYLEGAASTGSVARLFDALEKAFSRLEDNPYMHAVSCRPELEPGGLRECLVGRYAIVYRVEGDSVLLLRFLHQARDFGSLVVEW